MTDRILIIDFGSQVTQLIARRVRESGIYSEIHPFNKVSEDSITPAAMSSSLKGAKFSMMPLWMTAILPSSLT